MLAIGIRIAADSPTGVRLGALAGGTAATFTSFVTLLDVPDTGTVRSRPTIARRTAFNTFVTQNPLLPDDTLLTVGGEPSSRALLRFGLPDAFLDSTTIVRATLELTPVRPIFGLPTDSAPLQAVAVVERSRREIGPLRRMRRSFGRTRWPRSRPIPYTSTSPDWCSSGRAARYGPKAYF